MFTMGKIIGKKVVCIKGIRTDKRTSTKYVEPVYILFDDGKTFIRFEDQDLCYHDCACSAKHINVEIDENKWGNLISDDDSYPHATMDI